MAVYISQGPGRKTKKNPLQMKEAWIYRELKLKGF
jgi:hypothetical protein